MTRPCLRDGCTASAGPLHSECQQHRLETAILERFEGGDSVAHLASDYRVMTDYVEVIIRDEMAGMQARRRKWRPRESR